MWTYKPISQDLLVGIFVCVDIKCCVLGVFHIVLRNHQENKQEDPNCAPSGMSIFPDIVI